MGMSLVSSSSNSNLPVDFKEGANAGITTTRKIAKANERYQARKDKRNIVKKIIKTNFKKPFKVSIANS